MNHNDFIMSKSIVVSVMVFVIIYSRYLISFLLQETLLNYVLS